MNATTIDTVNVSTTTDLRYGAKFAASFGVVYLLTTCCDASAKGSGDGIVCRACYADVSWDFGAAWDASTFVTEYAYWLTGTQDAAAIAVAESARKELFGY